MNKIAVIESCGVCPHKKFDGLAGNWYCSYPKTGFNGAQVRVKEGIENNFVPEECPLPNGDGGSNIVTKHEYDLYYEKRLNG